ncbi:hypothetical protein DM01DRAFT_1334054 [Hesseltinella vesiculosa]|uniref:Uncharacterized protein n=1 Tax=Hesseltinella vesiculosa TaxID=101127 RepID=A0A1X2GMY9_9FUNG|nr:hypothetical protein DM01DRAFT_1334054 [Hesseltinella vesiculosa]
MTEDDVLYQRLLELTNDLNLQGQANQILANSLTSHFETFNKQDLTNEEHPDNDFDPDDLIPELVPENLASDEHSSALVSNHIKLMDTHHLAMTRNKQLEKECRELQLLVKDYESSLELVASKLRAYAMSAYEGQLQLQREYEALLNAEKDITASLFMENTMLQSQLTKLSSSLRSVYSEESKGPPYDQIHQLTIENLGLRELLKLSQQDQASLPPPSTPSPIKNPVLTTHLPSQVVDQYFSGP